jgi:hypothetical protein
VRVKPDALNDEHWQAGRSLRQGRVAGVLFHKSDLQDGKGLQLLDDWLDGHNDAEFGSNGILDYLWSAVALPRSLQLRDDAGRRLRHIALERMRRAEQNEGLGEHRRRRIARFMAEFRRSTPRRPSGPKRKGSQAHASRRR